jgi:hypothetical protein
VLDDLTAQDRNVWLDTQRQVPPLLLGSADLVFDFASRTDPDLGLLDVDPALRVFWDATTDPVTAHGLPVAFKDYGPFITFDCSARRGNSGVPRRVRVWSWGTPASWRKRPDRGQPTP